MPIDCQRSTAGGKGNQGRFTERDPKVCAAGIPTAQPDDKLSDSLEHYLLKDEVDSLISDAIIPPKPSRPLPPLRHPMKLDMRNAFYGEVAQIVNPPNHSKYKTLAEDMKNTLYTSYFNKALGQSRDPTPMLPVGFDIKGTTFGIKQTSDERLYDLVMPKIPMPDNTPRHKQLAVQMDRNYCRPAYDPDRIFGYKTSVDKSGKPAQCCLTDNSVLEGTSGRDVVNSYLADHQDVFKSRQGQVLAPNNNIRDVPEGHTFGKISKLDSVADCMTHCQINPDKEYFMKCFSHLNKLRKILSTRYLPTFFQHLYLGLKYLDKNSTGWLPNTVVYDYAGTKFIRFNASLIEPLLSLWNAFNGKEIEYKTFVRVINYRIPSPEPPKLPDFSDACIDYRTTYTEMVKPDQPPDCSPMAGLPSGRYFDMDYPVTPKGYCRAVRVYLPDEINMKACVNPSITALQHANHRDMYAKREPDIVRRVFENAGENFTDGSFKEIWEKAKQYHSEGWVCFETFRRALGHIQDSDI